MSSGGNGTQASDEKLSNLRAILGDGIPKARLAQVFEASNGSLEHAIEIYFGQMQQQPSQPTIRNPEVKCSPLTTSVGDESSPETITNNPGRGTQNATDPNTRDNSTTAVANKKRSQMNDRSEKRAGAKQARLDSFFRIDSNNDLPSPSPIQSAKDSEGQLDKGISDTNIITATSAMNSGVLSSTLRNTSTSKTIVKPKDGDSKKDRHTSEDPASFLTFQRLCETLQEMSDTTKRLMKLKALETLIREIIDYSENDANSATIEEGKTRALSSALGIVLGGITAIPLNVSGSAVSKALQTSLGVTRSQISKAYRKNGDIGDCAALYFQKKTHFVIASHRRQMSVLQVIEVSCSIVLCGISISCLPLLLNMIAYLRSTQLHLSFFRYLGAPQHK